MRTTRLGLVTALLLATSVGSAEEEKKPDAKPEQKEHREPLGLSAEWTLGFGMVQAIDTLPPMSLGTMARPVLVNSQVAANIFVLRAQYDVTPAIEVAFRFPFTIANLASVTEGNHQVALGNLELAGSYRAKLSDSFEAIAALGIALPTSLGTELPRQQADLDVIPPESFNKGEANRFAANQAAAAIYGYEQDQWFWSKRLGLTPSIDGVWTSGKLHARPFLKMLNLIDTRDASVERYRMELVFGSGIGYRALEWLDLNLRVWGSVAPVRRDGSPVGAGVASPEVRFIFNETGAVYVAGVLPFVGSNVDPFYFGGVRAGVSGRF